MSELKEKLSKRVEVVDKNNASDNVSNIQNSLTQNENKIVVLKQNETTQIYDLVPEFAISLNAAKERTIMLQNFVKEMMIPNVDYGIIQGCKKPSLLKPGAEMLSDIFGFSKHLEILNRFEDWDNGFFHYEVKIILVNKKTGLIEAEGIGSCNSKEKKFKNQDSYSIVNTVAKLAKKRALVDAVLSATRSSGIFTQDMEDLEPENSTNRYKGNNKTQMNNYRNTINQSFITKEQQLEIFKVINENMIPMIDAKSLLKEKYNLDQTKQLTTEQADEFIDILKCYSPI